MHSATLNMIKTLAPRGLFSILVLVLFSLAACPVMAASPVPRILVINSYHEGYDWSDDEMNGLRATLVKSFPRIELFSEYLDTKNFPNNSHFARVADLLETKYRGSRFDVIVVMDNAALEFVSQYRKRLFPDTPVVFCGINNYTQSMLAGQHPITGVAEVQDSVGTLDMALALHPATRQVLVVHDYTVTGLAIRHELEAGLARFRGVTIRFLEDMPLGQAVDALKILPADELVLILSYAVEKGGRTFTQAEAAQIISSASPVPAYAIHAAQLGHGVIGGKLLTGTIQGQKAAELAARIIRGTPADQLPVITASLSRTMFDYLVAQRFKVNLENLPPDVLIINTPAPTYAIHKTTFWLGTLFAVAASAGLIIFFLNIQRRKRLEEELRAEKERLAVTLRSIGDGVITTDTEGRIVLINRVAEELCGWKQAEATGKPLETVFRIINEAHRLPQKNPVFDVLSTGKVVELAHTLLVSRSGAERSIADSAAPILDENSEIIGVVLVFRDMTEKKHAEEELFKARKLESIGVLAGGIAHDFNNYLTAILGNISLARVFSTPGERIYDILEKAETASNRAKGLTQQLLTFAKGGSPVRKVASIGQIITDSVGFVLRGSNVRYECDIAGDLNPVEVDAGQMSQVINNLVINADQAMPDGGLIRIRAVNEQSASVNGSRLPAKSYVRLIFEDQGVGIPAADLNRIFDPYFSTKKQGSGLGLATVYSIIRKHHGDIKATSRLGEGTTFTIFLPAADGGQQYLEEKNIANNHEGSGRVLIMDDEKIICDVLSDMLELIGYDTETCRDGAEAVDCYRKALAAGKAFDAVIMDITIPGGIGGKEAILMLKKIDPLVRAIVSSGYANDPIMARCTEFGFAATLAKPYDISEVSAVLNRVLST